MSIINNKLHLRIMLIALMSSWVLSGCGRDAALDTYKQNMEVYFEGLSTLNERINSIDTASDTDGTKLLGYLDQLDSITSQMADLEVPEQFEIVDSLADEASENMSQAVSLYHELYESEEYNQSLADGAYEYYDRANMRIRYIHSILQGNIPEELEIVTEGESIDYSQNVIVDNSNADKSDVSDEDDYSEYVDEGGLEYLDVEE